MATIARKRHRHRDERLQSIWTSPGEADFLFVQSSKGMTFDKSANTLTLTGVSPVTVFFTDRPAARSPFRWATSIMQQLELTMTNEQQQPKPTTSAPDPLTDSDQETDPILKLGEVKVSRLQASIIGPVVIVIFGALLWAIYKHF
jgi:hypothetical protein